MYQGNWKCSTCGEAITELPFEPKSDKGLTCRACFAKNRDNGGSSGGAGASSGNVSAEQGSTEKKMHEGNWKCSGCGAAITSLPFEPRSTSNLRCIDCFKKSRE